VTPEGTLAALAGALTVGAAWEGGRILEGRRGERGGGAPARALLLTGAAGTAGALADSLLGATVQGAYWCPACQEPVETPIHPRCGGEAVLVHGRRWVDNDVVNALATGVGAILGGLLGV
jgi:uncharacterized membrane protein